MLNCLIPIRAFSQGRLCQTALVDIDGARYYRKRRVIDDRAIAFANRAARLDMQVLLACDWIDQETRLYQELYGMQTIPVDRATLLLPELPGQPVNSILRNASVDSALYIIRAATQSLADFHRRGLTHADATVRNVLFDQQSGDARWFDFETVHRSDLPVDTARALDLRTLLLSTAASVSTDLWPELIRTARLAYNDDVTFDALAQTAPSRLTATIFAIAQTGMPRAGAQRLLG